MWALEEGELGRMEVQIQRPAWEPTDAPHLWYVCPGVALSCKVCILHFFPRSHDIMLIRDLSLAHKHTHAHTHKLWKLSLFFYKYALSVSLELPPLLQQLRASPRGQASASLWGCPYPLQDPNNVESQRYRLCKHNFLSDFRDIRLLFIWRHTDIEIFTR